MGLGKVIFDIETTGLVPAKDEILQFSAINENGEVLLDVFIKPVNHTEWKEAEAIHHITPDMVSECKTMNELLLEIQSIFDNATELIGYNIDFDIKFLEQAGIKFKTEIETSDPMMDFAPIYGEWNSYYESYKWQKLTTAAYYYGYDIDSVAHNSLEDVKATLVVYNAIKNNLKPYNWIETQLLDNDGNVVFVSDIVTDVCDKSIELYKCVDQNRLNRIHRKGLPFDYYLKLGVD